MTARDRLDVVDADLVLHQLEVDLPAHHGHPRGRHGRPRTRWVVRMSSAAPASSTPELSRAARPRALGRSAIRLRISSPRPLGGVDVLWGPLIAHRDLLRRRRTPTGPRHRHATGDRGALGGITVADRRRTAPERVGAPRPDHPADEPARTGAGPHSVGGGASDMTDNGLPRRTSRSPGPPGPGARTRVASEDSTADECLTVAPRRPAAVVLVESTARCPRW